MAPSTAAGTSVARGYLPKIARAANHTRLIVSASPMRPRILAQPSAHGKCADMHLPATVVQSRTAQQSRAVREDPPGDGVGVVVADVHDDIQPHAAVGGDGLIQRGTRPEPVARCPGVRRQVATPSLADNAWGSSAFPFSVHVYHDV